MGRRGEEVKRYTLSKPGEMRMVLDMEYDTLKEENRNEII